MIHYVAAIKSWSVPALAFWSSLIVAETVETTRVTHELPDVYTMAALSAGIAALAGALRQLELFSNQQSTNCSGIVCGCAFSGIAGFIAYAFSREYIDDPLKLVVEAILAGLVGAELVKHLAKTWLEKFKGKQK